MIRGLTVRQPFAGFLVADEAPRLALPKTIENRVWPVVRYRGLVAIHAAKRVDELALYDHLQRIHLGSEQGLLDVVTTRAIVGVAELVDCTQDATGPWAVPFHYHWQFANARRLAEPIPWLPGKTSLWPVPEDLERQIMERLGGAA
jgi:hypothetical protein